MKELSIEEKAKAYDDAIDKIKYVMEHGVSPTLNKEDLQDIFPELKESEDEKIKKEIIEYVQYLNEYFGDSMPNYGKWLVWLEKQGEQKPDDNRLIPQKGEYYVCIKDYYSADGKTTNTKGKIYKSPCDGYINDDKGFGLSWINSCTENHFRPIKEEDWIICEQNNVIGKPLQYKEFMNNKLIQKNIKSLEDNGIVPNFRLWDISDAKDGDILAFKNNIGGIIICKSPTNYDTRSYCRLISDNLINKEESGWNSTLIVPATKEQREQLEKAMADAGYTFDFEKKELKKIEQKSVDKVSLKDRVQLLWDCSRRISYEKDLSKNRL